MNGVAFGTCFVVVAVQALPGEASAPASPAPGDVLVVEDRYGCCTQADIAMPGNPAGAAAWGRRTITLQGD